MGGYTALAEKLLAGIEVRTGVEYRELIDREPDIAPVTVYSGCIDEFFDYCYGPLQYRSVRFETETLDMEDYQGNAVVNYTGREVPWTRIIEHKHFDGAKSPVTVISREYSAEWQPGQEPYYPVNNPDTAALLSRYEALAMERPDVIFGGRLGRFRYYDMDKVIGEALETAKQLIAGR